MNPVPRVRGARLLAGCCAYSYRDQLSGKAEPALTMEQFVDVCAKIGIDGVELTSYYFPGYPELPSYAAVRSLARRCFRNGLDICGTAVGNRFTLPAGEERDRQIRLVKDWTDRAIDMGAPVVRVFAGNAPEGVSEEQAAAWCVECLKDCCEHAGRLGVSLALENHHGITDLPGDVLYLLGGVNSDWLGVQLDTGNFFTDDPYRDIERIAPHAIAVHIKTEVVRAGAREPADLERIAGILRRSGYRGYCNLEYEGAEPAASAVPEALHRIMSICRHEGAQ